MTAMTSLTHPLPVDFIPEDLLNMPGRLGITVAPGRRGPSSKGDWDRDLDIDLARLSTAMHTDVLVSLLTAEEAQHLGTPLPKLQAAVKAQGMENLQLPIEEGMIPGREELHVIVHEICERLAAGSTVVIHCRAGHGRSGTVAAAVLIEGGMEPDAAIAVVRAARKGTIEPSQEKFVRTLVPPPASREATTTACLLDVIEAHLKEKGFVYTPTGDVSRLSMTFTGKAGQYGCIAGADEEAQRAVFLAFAPVKVPSERREAVFSLIGRVNYKLATGCFEMDASDGELLFYVAIDVEGGQLVPKMVENMMRPALFYMDRFMPVLLGVVYGGEDPAIAAARLVG